VPATISHWAALIILSTALLCAPPKALRAEQGHEPFDQFDIGWEDACPAVDDDSMCKFTIRITGQIVTGTAARFEKALAHSQQRRRLFIILDSQGGDIAAAMKIGRMIRSSRGHTIIDGQATCASACVLIFGAGVSRFSWAGKLGMHRPALAAAPAQSDMTAVKAAADQAAGELRAYAAEMNISGSLIDDMLVVPPQSIQWLTGEDRQRYGLGFLDPVYEETAVLDGAKKYGISPSEYRRRDFIAKSVCSKALTDDEFYGILEGKRTKCAEGVLVSGKDPFPDDWILPAQPPVGSPQEAK
jgi:ATP-dependent protease ClpP protease subunit